ncbi:MAG: AAA family ATPase [Erysipelotrichaceae bacterium]|nr:AAA family ATPase [Erysipelotrichaceae bacterium]
MRTVCKELFRAIHERCWLYIEYHNKKEENTKYWISVKELNPFNGSIVVDGMHLRSYEIKELKLSIDRITSAKVIEGTYAPVPESLIVDIRDNPEKYVSVFSDTVNLKILNYLDRCNRLDQTPYKTDAVLVDYLDDEILGKETLKLNPLQFDQMIKGFQKKTDKKQIDKLQMIQLGLNLLSINTHRGIYILAYQPLKLDVKNRTLKAEDDIEICSEFTIDGEKQSIRQFIDAEDLHLLNDFKNNAEKIREIISQNNQNVYVDDMPYLIEIARNPLIDLNYEYNGILDMYQNSDYVTEPIRAFFGELTSHSMRKKSYPLILTDSRINLDQLSAMNHAMRYPISYVQGPPGTGKTRTIVNIIVTSFFNERTVLFSSYNNHPIDEVVDQLKELKCGKFTIPFPVVRLGNNIEVANTIKQIRSLYETVKDINVSEASQDRNFNERSEQAKALTEFLESYEERVDLLERKDTIEQLLRNNTQMNFQVNIQTGQLREVDQRLKELKQHSIEDALKLIDTDFEAIMTYLNYASIKYIKRISEPKNEDLKKILYMTDEKEQLQEFNRYLSTEENLKKFLRIFPIVATTCISAHKLADPKPVFDMTIIDEASQCNTAISLVPIIRGRNMLLVGDPQQLQPVIVMNPSDSKALRNKFGVSEEYDYCTSSIYKTYLACDAVSDEVLLSHHYRCDSKIIGFNNRKYYNNKLKMHGKQVSKNPLVFVNVPDDTSVKKNTAPKEAEAIINYIKNNPDKKIGVITPFVNQKELINKELELSNIEAVECGTVHAFQGDEKDVILFSLGLTNRTSPETYNWLKNNKELINVSTSRAKYELILFSNESELQRLHVSEEDDDLYDLYQYVKTDGQYQVAQRLVESRALGIRPYSTETETAFMESLSRALDNAFQDGSKFVVHKEVALSQVFLDNISHEDFFYRGRFDFVVFRKVQKEEIPVLAIELDGKEHLEDDVVKRRDELKQKICREHHFELIRVDNTYARRYHYIKDILIKYFQE